MQDAPGISIVLVNWNSKDDLRQCLQSLAAQTERDFEVIVVDNGSTDGSLEMVRDEFGSVRLIAAGENLGFAEGCNRGIEQARGAWVAMLNNDTVAQPNWVAELRRVADGAAADVGVLQARLLFKHDPGRTNSTGVLVFSGGEFVDRDYDAPVRPDDAGGEIFCASAGAALYRRAMLDAVRLETGYFDRTFFMYYEDVDLGWRCRLGGWSAHYLPAATVHHAFHGSAARRGNDFVRRHCFRNRVRVLCKNASWSYVLGCMPRLLSEFAWYLLRVGPSAFRDYAAAWRDGVAQRGAVSRISRVLRRDVERRWVSRRAA